MVTTLGESHWKKEKKSGIPIQEFQKHYASYLIYKIIRSEITVNLCNNSCKLLEIGAGASRSSLLLSRGGATPFFLDTSISALNISQDLAFFHNIGAHHIQGDAFTLPFKDDSFDVVWSGGLLEHFHKKEQQQLIKEHIRVTNKGGKAIIIVPHRNAQIYNLSRQIAQKLGTWPYGPEEPMSGTDFISVKGVRLKVYSKGLLHQIGAISVLPLGGFLSLIVNKLVRFLLRRKYEEIDLRNGKYSHHLIAVYEKVMRI
jgi:ubiquinone/menaquinone biosynthesis C-methylase UbiE